MMVKSTRFHREKQANTSAPEIKTEAEDAEQCSRLNNERPTWRKERPQPADFLYLV